MLDIFWRKSLALTVFENIRVAIPIAKIETRQCDLLSMFKINFIAYSGCRNFLVFIMLPGTIRKTGSAIAKTGFHFWCQIQIWTEISQNYAHISGQGSNFETSGGRLHSPDICRVVDTTSENRLPIIYSNLKKLPNFPLRTTQNLSHD